VTGLVSIHWYMDEVEKANEPGRVTGRKAERVGSGGRRVASGIWVYVRALLVVGLLGVLVEREITRPEGRVILLNRGLTDFLVAKVGRYIMSGEEFSGLLQRRGEGIVGGGEEVSYSAWIEDTGVGRVLVGRFTQRAGSGAYKLPPGPIDLANILLGLPFENRLVLGIVVPIDASSDVLSQRILRRQMEEINDQHVLVSGVVLEPVYDDEMRSLDVIAELQIGTWEPERWPLIPELGATFGYVDGGWAGEHAFSRLLLVDIFPSFERQIEGHVRIPLLARKGDRLFPSLPLWLYLYGEGLGDVPVSLMRGQGVSGGVIEVGGRRFPIDPSGCMVLSKDEADRLSIVEVTELTHDMIMEGRNEQIELLVIDYEGQPGLIVDDPDGVAGQGGWVALATAALKRGWISPPTVTFTMVEKWQLWSGTAFFCVLVLSCQILSRRKRLFSIIPIILLYWIIGMLLITQFLILHDFLLPVVTITASWMMVLAAPEARRMTRPVREDARQRELRELLFMEAEKGVDVVELESGPTGMKSSMEAREDSGTEKMATAAMEDGVGKGFGLDRVNVDVNAPQEAPVKSSVARGFLESLLAEKSLRPIGDSEKDKPGETKERVKEKEKKEKDTAAIVSGKKLEKNSPDVPVRMLEIAEFSQCQQVGKRSDLDGKESVATAGKDSDIKLSRKSKKRRDREALAERERAEKERAEKERAEKERVEKERVEKERVERERAEKERVEKGRAEKERVAKERVEKERVERERVEK